jgi:hypothetical protein
MSLLLTALTIMVVIALRSLIMLVIAHPRVKLSLLLFLEFLVAKELIAAIIFGGIVQCSSDAAISAGRPKDLLMVSLTYLVIYLVWVSATRTLGFEVIQIVIRFRNVQASRFKFCLFHYGFLCL